MSRRPAVIEAATAVVSLAFLLGVLRSMLIFGETTLTHDNIYWNYPAFHFFAENLINWNFPLWNPYSHGGEPFYPLLFQFKFLDPFTIITVLGGHLITDDMVMLFNWHRFLTTLALCLGTYLVLRPITAHMLIRLTLIPILLFSSFTLGSFWQDGIINQFTWVPFIVYFLLRIVLYRDNRWHNWLFLAALIGLNWQSYFFAGVWTLLLFFFLGLLLFNRDMLRGLAGHRGFGRRFAAASVVVLLMMAPNLALMQESDNFVYPLRAVSLETADGSPGSMPPFESRNLESASSVRMTYENITGTGAFSQVWDFIQTISPEGNRDLGWPGLHRWGGASEAFMFIGFLPWAIAILGMVAGKHEMKRVWLLAAAGFGLLMLGPAGGLHTVLYYLYPPMWFMRNTHALNMFFIFMMLYFYVLGCNYIYATWRNRNFLPLGTGSVKSAIKPEAAFALFLSVVIASLLLMTWPAENGIKLVYPYLILPVAIGWLLRKPLGRGGLYYSVLGGQILAIFFLTDNPHFFILYGFVSFGLPAFMFFRFKSTLFESVAQMRRMTAAVVAIGILCLTGDLAFCLLQSKNVYASEKRPLERIVNNPGRPTEPLDRSASPVEYLGRTEQAIRYPSLILNRPYAFSPIMTKPVNWNGKAASPADLDYYEKGSFEYALKSMRWNSFLLTRHYYRLINLDIPASAMEKMFAIGEPPIQFKKGTVATGEDKIAGLLGRLGQEGSRRLLEGYVVIDKAPESGSGEDVLKAGERMEADKSSGFSYEAGAYDYDSINIKARAAEAGVLYWADGYDRWWKAFVNGNETPVFRANVNFKAIALPAGESTVRFVYRPVAFLASLAVFYAAFLGALAFSLATYITKGAGRRAQAES